MRFCATLEWRTRHTARRFGTARRGRHHSGPGPAAGLRLSFQTRLIQDAAYENLLKSRRQVLHRRVAEVLRKAMSPPPRPNRSCSRITSPKRALPSGNEWWGKAGQRSLERSALVEAVEQFTRALTNRSLARHAGASPRADQAPGRADNTAHPHQRIRVRRKRRPLRSKHICLIEQAEAFGEPPEDPLLLFSVLYGFWVANLSRSRCATRAQLAAQFLTLAEKQGASGR